MTKKRKRYTPEEDEIIRTRYPHEPNKHIARDMGISIDQLRGRAYNLGVTESQEKREKRLKKFSKAGVPTQLGKVKRRGGKRGQGKKKKPRGVPLGTIRKDSFGYRHQKMMRDGKPVWIPIHRLIWENHHGPVPEKQLVVFRDGNADNLAIENLECITYQEVIRRNGMQRYPEELREAIFTLSRLKKEINKNER